MIGTHEGRGGTPPPTDGEETAPDDDARDEGIFADLTGLRVVVVEDDADGREMLLQILSTQGAECVGVGTAEEGIRIVASFHPDVLVSDVGLPDMDGFALLRHVRRLSVEDGGHVPAIALTGYADLEDCRQALAAGYQVHVAKPVEAWLLTQAVANVAGVAIDS